MFNPMRRFNTPSWARPQMQMQPQQNAPNLLNSQMQTPMQANAYGAMQGSGYGSIAAAGPAMPGMYGQSAGAGAGGTVGAVNPATGYQMSQYNPTGAAPQMAQQFAAMQGAGPSPQPAWQQSMYANPNAANQQAQLAAQMAQARAAYPGMQGQFAGAGGVSDPFLQRMMQMQMMRNR